MISDLFEIIISEGFRSISSDLNSLIDLVHIPERNRSSIRKLLASLFKALSNTEECVVDLLTGLYDIPSEIQSQITEDFLKWHTPGGNKNDK